MRNHRDISPKYTTKSNTIHSVTMTIDQLVKVQRLIANQSTKPGIAFAKEILTIENPASQQDRRYHYDSGFKIDYLLHNIFRKCNISDLGSAEDRRKAALASLFKGERHCLRTNRRLRQHLTAEQLQFVVDVHNYIGYVLGDINDDMVENAIRVSSGATATLKLRDASIDNKLAFENPSCTFPFAKHFLHFFRKENDSITGYEGGSPLLLIPGNRILTVPKNSKTDRTIAAEPTLNSMVQLGLGSLIRKRLRKIGVCLNDQTINQRLALEGSIKGNLATIDLENASNSLAYETVKLLVPYRWFEYLDITRSPYGSLNGRIHRYQMFSSMGNGYTFELESLIFYAICRVASRYRDDVSVYGDDIICNVEDANNCIKWLHFFGFNTNLEKTFIDGFFKESCGKHYYFGEDVSPFFVRELPSGSSVILLYNNIVRWSKQDGYTDIRLEKLREYVLSLFPLDSRIFGPDGYGEAWLLDHTPDCHLTKYILHKKYQCLAVRGYVESSEYEDSNQVGGLAASLYGYTKDNIMSQKPLRKKRWKLMILPAWSTDFQ